MVLEINNVAVNMSEDGYMTDLGQWNEEVAQAIAAEEGVALTDRHWTILAYLQDQFRNDVPLTIRKMGTSGVTNIKEFYDLFPGGPLKKATRIAGIPKPKSCI